MVNLNPFSWGKKTQGYSDQELGMIGSVLAADSQRTQTDIEMQRDLGTNFHMTESQELMNDLSKLAERRVDVYATGKDGLVLLDKEGHPITEHRVYYHPVFMTLKVEVNRLHSMRWLDPTDAEIAIHQVRYNFKKQKMKLTYDEYKQWGGFIDALERLALSAISDSLHGRKPRLLKMQPRSIEMQLNRPQKTQGPGVP